jgi:hypothetical protein
MYEHLYYVSKKIFVLLTTVFFVDTFRLVHTDNDLDP